MKATFHIGDQVRVTLGRGKIWGIVKEDRGPIGVGGRRLYQVWVETYPTESSLIEIPEEEMERAERESTLDKGKIEKYLIHGGLTALLRSNASGGNAPRVWLCSDSLGNITHTFVEERGVLGGQQAPAQAMHNNKVFLPKKSQVIEFLQSFGLDRSEAEQILARVGTAP